MAIKIAGNLIIDDSQNITVDGTAHIGGAITGPTITALENADIAEATARATADDEVTTAFTSADTAFMPKVGGTFSDGIYGTFLDFSSSIDGNTYHVNGTQIVDSSRNLTNIGTMNVSGTSTIQGLYGYWLDFSGSIDGNSYHINGVEVINSSSQWSLDFTPSSTGIDLGSTANPWRTLYLSSGIQSDGPVNIYTASGEADVQYRSGAAGGVGVTEWQVGTGWDGATGGVSSFFWYASTDGVGGGKMDLKADGELGVAGAVRCAGLNSSDHIDAQNSYIYANHFWSTSSTDDGAVTGIFSKQGDDFHRVASAGAVRTFLNVADGANNYTYTLPAPLSGYTNANTANTVVERDASGDFQCREITASYYGSTDALDWNPITSMITKQNGDNWHRSSSAGHVRTFLNVANGANAYIHPTTGTCPQVPATHSHNFATSYYGTAIGASSESGDYGVSVGQQAGQNSDTSGQGTHRNAFVGYKAGEDQTAGGWYWGSMCTFMGYYAGQSNGYGSYNTLVGASTLTNTEGGVGNNSGFGYEAGSGNSPVVLTGTNTICLGNDNVSALYCKDSSISTSDLRDKTDIEDFSIGLDFVNDMRSITYRWDNRTFYREKDEHGKDVRDMDNPTLNGGGFPESMAELESKRDGSRKQPTLHTGFIAQEVIELLKPYGYCNDKDDHLFINYGDDGEKLGMKYEKLAPVLVNAIQELSAKNDALEARLATLEAA